MRLADLHKAQVRGADGERLGRVDDVLCEEGEVKVLLCGAGGLLARFTGRPHGRRIPWSAVRRVAGGTVTVDAAACRD